MRKQSPILMMGWATLHALGCASATRQPSDCDLAHNPFPEAQAEIRAILAEIIHDSETGDVQGLRDVHLNTDKFTKFGGGSTYERMDYAETIDAESTAIASVQDYKAEARDVKIDVFGNVAVVTYYPHRVVTKNDEVQRYSTRQTLVFLKTPDGWKIVHEHQSPKRYDLAHYSFPEAQAELREILESMEHDSASGDVASLRAAHLETDKFTRFGGNKFERVGYDECIAVETAFYSSIRDLVWDVQDLKIDVFGDVAVVTCTPGLSYTHEGEAAAAAIRLTLVFLKTADGWKIVHEHGVPKESFEHVFEQRHSLREPIAGEQVVHEDHYFDSDGVTIRYVDVGPRDAEPVVLIHGGFSNIEGGWMESGVIDALDDDYRVIALDLRGHGKSDKPHDVEAYGNEMVEDVVRLLDHLNIQKAHIVGYSMGGRITFKLVADHPARVISAMPNGTDAEPLSTRMQEVLERTAHALEQSGSVRPVIDHFATDGSMTEEEIEHIVTSLRATNDTKAVAAVVRSFPGFRPDRSKLKANTVPCLCVIGEHDPNRAALAMTTDYMANLQIQVIEGENHMTAFRSPAFVEAIRDFIGSRALKR